MENPFAKNMNRSLKMKEKILLIMPDFFSTKENLCKALQINGFEVVAYSDRPASKLAKAIIRINRFLFSLFTHLKINRIISENRTVEFKTIIVVAGQAFTKRHISKLLKNVHHSESVFYMWDSIKSYPYTVRLLPLFQTTITFNLKDYKANHFDHFLPLFIPFEYYPPKKNTVEAPILYDLAFVGTARPSKYGFIKKIINEAHELNLKVFAHLYLPYKPLFYLFKLFDSRFRHAKISQFRFYKLSADEIKRIYSISKYILDSGNPQDDGLSLRIFESIGLHKKIVLTNETIKEYKFYNEKNFYVWNGRFDVNNIFFHSKYCPLDVNLFLVGNWVMYLVNPKSIKRDVFINYEQP